MGGSPTRNMERQLNLFGYLFEKERKTYQLTGEELSDVLVCARYNLYCLVCTRFSHTLYQLVDVLWNIVTHLNVSLSFLKVMLKYYKNKILGFFAVWVTFSVTISLH